MLLVTAGKARVFDGKGFSGLQAVLATANGRGVWGRRALSPPPVAELAKLCQYARALLAAASPAAAFPAVAAASHAGAAVEALPDGGAHAAANGAPGETGGDAWGGDLEDLGDEGPGAGAGLDDGFEEVSKKKGRGRCSGKDSKHGGKGGKGRQ